MLSRRAFMGKLAAGAAGAGVALTATAAAANVAGRTSSPSPATESAGNPPIGPQEALDLRGATEPQPENVVPVPPWELLSPLAAGSVIAEGWKVADLSGVRDGSCVVTLEKGRRSHRVHICRNDGQPQGLVYTRRLDLVVMNGGQGELPTEEGFAQAVAELAHVLAANEHRLGDDSTVALLSHAERQRLSGAQLR